MENEMQEPIAWMVTNTDGQDAYVTADPALANSAQRALPLYTAPVMDTCADVRSSSPTSGGGFVERELATARGLAARRGAGLATEARRVTTVMTPQEAWLEECAWRSCMITDHDAHWRATQQRGQIAMSGDDWLSERDKKCQARAEKAYKAASVKAAASMRKAATS